MNIKYLALSSALFASLSFGGDDQVGHQAAPVETVEHEDAGASESNNFTGLYAGGGFGINFHSCEIKGTTEEGKTDEKLTDKGPTAFGGVGVIGYGYTFPNNFYLGGECDIHVGYGSGNGIKINPFSIGGSVKGGYDFGNIPVLVYALLGFENHGLSYTSSGSKDTKLNDMNERMTSFRIGAGGEYKMGDGWGVRADVLYAFKSSGDSTNKSKNTNKAIKAPDKVKYSDGVLEFRLMGVYNFGSF